MYSVSNCTWIYFRAFPSSPLDCMSLHQDYINLFRKLIVGISYCFLLCQSFDGYMGSNTFPNEVRMNCLAQIDQPSAAGIFILLDLNIQIAVKRIISYHVNSSYPFQIRMPTFDIYA